MRAPSPAKGESQRKNFGSNRPRLLVVPIRPYYCAGHRPLFSIAVKSADSDIDSESVFMFQDPIVMLDFETTGLSPAAGARITEVAALRIVDGRIADRFVSLVNCHVRVPAFITGLTGITQQMVDRAPCVSQVVPELLRFIGTDALSAHNASFDEKFLLAESRDLGLAAKHSSLICSLKLSRRLFPGLPSYKLATLSSTLGIRFNGTAHRAEADAEVSAKLLIHIGEHLGRTYQAPCIDARLLARVTALSAAKVPDFLRTELRSRDK
jgi:DNA polymerase III subunit epsilon